jgi:hypothetical protein
MITGFLAEYDSHCSALNFQVHLVSIADFRRSMETTSASIDIHAIAKAERMTGWNAHSLNSRRGRPDCDRYMSVGRRVDIVSIIRRSAGVSYLL